MERQYKGYIINDLPKKMVFLTSPRQVGKAWLDTTKLLILDELQPGWRNDLKGVYDIKPEHLMVLVTGSARLEAFRQGGDSLAGRFFRHRLMPFSPAELSRVGVSVHPENLLAQGGFPEPFLAENPVDADRWRMQYIDGLIRNLKTKEKKEVDFCIVNDDNPELFIEVKRSDPKPADALLYFTNKYGVPGMQLVLRLKREKQVKGVEIRRGVDYLKSLLI